MTIIRGVTDLTDQCNNYCLNYYFTLKKNKQINMLKLRYDDNVLKYLVDFRPQRLMFYRKIKITISKT